MHGGKNPPYAIPDYKVYSIKGIPQLEEVEAALKKVGLRDPWLRNEAWRYHPGFGTMKSRAIKLLFRGAPYGAGLALVHFGIYMALQHSHGHPPSPCDKEGGH